MRVRLSSGADGDIWLQSDYREWEPFREAFKAAIPWSGRRWDSGNRRWVISAIYLADLMAFLAQHQARIQDDRQAETARLPMPDDLREAYAALHLDASAPLCVAEASYRALSKYYHPDVGGTAAQFQAVSDAIRVVRSYLNPQETHDGTTR